MLSRYVNCPGCKFCTSHVMLHELNALHLKVHLTPKCFYAKTIKLILWSIVLQKFFDLVKSSNFCAPLKPSFVSFTNEHGESGESKAVTSIPERKTVWPFTLSERRGLFAAQVSRWCFTVDRFLFLSTISSTSSDSEMSFDSEDSEIYYVAEENDDSHISTTQSE